MSVLGSVLNSVETYVREDVRLGGPLTLKVIQEVGSFEDTLLVLGGFPMKPVFSPDSCDNPSSPEFPVNLLRFDTTPEEGPSVVLR